MPVRTAIVAGRFYPASPEECRAQVEECLSAFAPEAAGDAETGAPLAADQLTAIGGIVPHAGWVCSGAVAARVIRVLAADTGVETFVIFGAVHRLAGPRASVYARGGWRTPLGEIAIDEALGAAIVGAGSGIVEDPAAHEYEHSIEVQLPFIQHLLPSAKLLPITVPPSGSAHEVGRAVAEQVRAVGRKVVFLGSTDLTHYGPGYEFTPQGVGPAALRWAKEVNDRRILDLALNLRAEQVVGEAQRHRNACGSGAMAATIAACRESGADTARLLEHTSSHEVLRERYGEMSDSVGYAGIIFGKSGQASQGV